MLKQPLLLFSVLCATLFAKAQHTESQRYKDFVFSEITINKNISYALSPTTDNGKANLFDLYQPKDDHSAPRPLIIWMHGGGFIFGSKEAKGIQIWSKTFAQRGYVCAAINYSLSKKNPLFHFDELIKGCYYAVQDARMAVAYFTLHHAEYNIDPNKIILAGNSAGGLIAMQAAYSTNKQLAESVGVPDTSTKHTGVLKVAGVINFWGGIFNLTWLNNAHVPIVNVLGSRDRIVAPAHKNTSLYGGVDIHQKADSLHIPNQLKVFEGYSHELEKHFNPIFAAGKKTRGRWLEAGQFTADFLYNTILK